MTDICVLIHAAVIVYILYRLRVYEKAMYNVVQLLKVFYKELEELNEQQSSKNGKAGVANADAGAEDEVGNIPH